MPLRRVHRTLLVWSCLLVSVLLAHAADVKVYAAASLTDVMQALANDYQAQGRDHIVFNFAGSNVLARQIEQGAPADIFLPADEAQMNAVVNAGLIANASRLDLLSNTLVIVLPADSEQQVAAPRDLEKNAFKRIATGDPDTVPAGVYAKQYLESVGVWKNIVSKITPAENVRAALAFVASGNADAALVYKTDALSSKQVRIAYEVPAGELKIRYPIALVKDAAASAEATAFLHYLESARAAAVFARYGFAMAGK
jgi:molybdate transport system substrate-binding protein